MCQRFAVFKAILQAAKLMKLSTCLLLPLIYMSLKVRLGSLPIWLLQSQEKIEITFFFFFFSLLKIVLESLRAPNFINLFFLGYQISCYLSSNSSNKKAILESGNF